MRQFKWDRVTALRAAGWKIRDIAEALGIGVSTVDIIISRWKNDRYNFFDKRRFLGRTIKLTPA